MTEKKENKVLKLEHCAEFMVEVFFKHFLTHSNEIQVWSKGHPVSPQHFLSFFNCLESPKKLKVEGQIPLRGHFEIHKEYFNVEQTIKIDSRSCLDCGIITKSKIIPIEVKSGANVKKIFKKLTNVGRSETFELSGNMVKILNLHAEGKKILQHKSQAYPDLSRSWILIMKSDKEAKIAKDKLPQDNLPVILTLTTIQEYLERHGLMAIVLKQIVKEFFSLYVSAPDASSKAA